MSVDAAAAAAALGFIIEPTARDGNCLFQAVAIQTDTDAADVRRRVARWLKQNCVPVVKPFLRPGQTCEKYVLAIAKSGVYGGDPELTAIEGIYRRPLEIYQSGESGDLERVPREGRADAVGEPIRLLYRGGGRGAAQYDALMPAPPSAEMMEAAAGAAGLLLESAATVAGAPLIRGVAVPRPVAADVSAGLPDLAALRKDIISATKAIVTAPIKAVRTVAGRAFRGTPAAPGVPAASGAPATPGVPGVPATAAAAVPAAPMPPAAAADLERLRTPPPAPMPIIAGTFVLVKDAVLVHLRGPTMSQPGTVSIPTGTVEPTDTSPEDAARRELKEEAQVDLSGVAMTVLRSVVQDGKRFILYVAKPAERPAVGAPTDPAELTKWAATDLSADVVGDGWSAWVDRRDLAAWLEANPAAVNTLFVESLAALNESAAADVSGAAAAADVSGAAAAADVSGETAEVTIGVPAWVPAGLISPDDVTTACKSADFITPDCIPKALLQNIQVAEEWRRAGRLVKRDDPQVARYAKLSAELAELKEQNNPEDLTKRAELQAVLDSEFYDEQVVVRRGDDFEVFTVPNPYRALAYRERDPAGKPNFANPAPGPTQYDPDGSMAAANARLLEAVAPQELVADHDMAVALLESLWFCGRNPSLSNDPRCVPAKILGELREWEANKQALAAAALVKKRLLTRSSWPLLKLWTWGLLNAAAGTTKIYPVPPREPEEVAPTGAPAEPAAPEGAPTEEDEEEEKAVAVPAAAPKETIEEALVKPAAPAPAAAAAAAIPEAPRRRLAPIQSVPVIPLGGGRLVPLLPVPLRL